MATPARLPPDPSLAEQLEREGPSPRWLAHVLLAYAAASSFAALSYGMTASTLALVLLLGGAIVARSVVLRGSRTASHGLGISFHQIGRGRLADAEAVLDVVDRFAFLTWTRRLSDVQRATIAVRRGELAEAVPLLDRAVERPMGRLRRAFDAHQIVSARSMRAFVLASLGAREAAASDIAAVRATGHADADALARASLAEALLLEKSGERDALRELIHRDSELLYEHTHPRERAVVRALTRMLSATATTVYRQKASDSDRQGGSEEPALADWIERVVPGAGRFAGAPGRRFAAAESEDRENVLRPTQRGVQAVVASRAAGERAAHERSANFIATVVAFAVVGSIGIYVLSMAQATIDFTGGAAPPTTATAFAGYALSIAVACAAFVAVAVRLHQAWLGRRHRSRLSPALTSAMSRATEGARDAAKRELQALSESPSHLVAAQAHLSLAVLAEREARFSSVLRHCDAAIARLATPRLRAAAGLLLPDAISLRAFALSALERFDEAQAELAGIYGTYPHRELAVYRVHLVELVRTGRVREAATWAEEHALDLPLTVREELLTDLVRATCHPEVVGAGEVARLRTELHRSETLRRWIETVAPAVVDAFRNGGFEQEVQAHEPQANGASVDTGVRIAHRQDEDEDHDAEIEARAQQEAEPELALVKALRRAPEPFR